MIYPKKLDLHATPQYNYLETFASKDGKNENYFTYAYYHDKTQYPLLMHKHDFYEINIVTQGEGRHYIEEASVNAQAGSVFVIPPNILHGYYAGADLEIFHLALSESFMTNFSKELHSLKNYPLLFEIEPMLRTSLNENIFLSLSDEELQNLIPELNNTVRCEQIKYSGMLTLKNAKALSVIGYLTYLYTQKKSDIFQNTQPFAKNFVNCINYLHKNYNEKIYVQDLADQCFMSYSTFSRNFKKIFKLSPNDYLLKLRIENAKQALKETNKSILEIALDCGFFDQSHFSHYFYKFEKMSPAKYRALLSES